MKSVNISQEDRLAVNTLALESDGCDVTEERDGMERDGTAWRGRGQEGDGQDGVERDDTG